MDEDAKRVAALFGEDTIERLVNLSKFPPNGNRHVLVRFVQDAAYFYFQESRLLSAKSSHDEVEQLFKAADQKSYDTLEKCIREISPGIRASLKARADWREIQFPEPTDFQNVLRRDAACEAILSLTSLGISTMGRRRSNGKNSRTIKPTLYAPTSPRNFSTRVNELAFVERLQVTWREATDCEPARTANRYTAGPFVRFVKECLRLVGAPHADPSGLINAINRRKTGVSTTKV